MMENFQSKFWRSFVTFHVCVDFLTECVKRLQDFAEFFSWEHCGESARIAFAIACANTLTRATPFGCCVLLCLN